MPSSTPKGAATREKLLHATARLIKKHGYHRTGLQEIIAESRTPKGSLYFHFPSGKEQIVAEAMDYACDRSLADITQLVNAAKDTGEAIEKVFEYGYGLMAASERQDICPIGIVSLQASEESEIIRKACRNGLSRLASTFREPLLKDGVPEELVSDVTMLIAGAIEGAFVLSRTYADEQQMLRAGKLLATMVKSYARPQTKPRKQKV